MFAGNPVSDKKVIDETNVKTIRTFVSQSEAAKYAIKFIMSKELDEAIRVKQAKLNEKMMSKLKSLKRK